MTGTQVSSRPLVFQFWHSDPPVDVARCIASWRDDERFEHRLYNDKTARNIVAATGEPEIVAAFDQSAVPAMRSDIFRYCALYLHGGIYADVRLTAGDKLMQLYESCGRGLLFTRVRPFPKGTVNITNSFMIMKEQKSLLMLNLLKSAAYNATRKTSNNVWQVTGPYIPSYLWELCQWNNMDLFKDVTLMAEAELRSYIQFCDVAYRREGKNWWAIQRTRSIFHDDAERLTLTLIEPNYP
jgi:mannosyltransferase OCH1-like enzyme